MATSAHSAEFDVKYFNGVVWGSKLSKEFKLVGSGDPGEKFYSRRSDQGRLDLIPVQELIYSTTNGNFKKAHAAFLGVANYQKLRALTVKSFGPGLRLNNMYEVFRLRKSGRTVTVNLQYNQNQGSGLINYAYANKDLGALENEEFVKRMRQQ
jgi:hypothetical protein